MNCYRCGSRYHFVADCTEPPQTVITQDLEPAIKCFVCGQPGHVAIACRLHPSRLRAIRGEACGEGPCTGSCRQGDHQDCAFGWCRCICHVMFEAIATA